MLKTSAATSVLLVLALAACGEQLSFPGAEGFGTTTPGGRGGKVILVTNLDDDGEGSLRAACTAEGPRIVVFRVGGTIRLKSHLRIDQPYITIAGQTATGDGILLRDAGLVIASHNVIVRFLRVRIGASTVEKYNSQDPIRVEGEAHHVVVDHCSFSWSIDECGSIRGPCHDITYSWCIFGEALRNPLPPEVTDDEVREHSMGMILGGTPDRCTLHHNLFLHNNSRNPRIQGGLHDFRNNVIYNWGAICAMPSRNPRVNFVGNYYKPGADSDRIKATIWQFFEKYPQFGRFYVKGNISPRRLSDDLDDWQHFVAPKPEGHRAPKPFPTPPVRTTSAAKALQQVLENAGCTKPRRDTVDLRYVADVTKETGKIIDKPEQVGGFPEIKGGEAPRDEDKDGMPDEWEKEKGLNPGDPTDHRADRDNDGYTNIEEYINSLAR